MNRDSAACYQSNRALVQSFHSHLLAYLPDECPCVDVEANEGGMERIPLEIDGCIVSRLPKYGVVFGLRDERWLLDYCQVNTETLVKVHIVEADERIFAGQMTRHSFAPLLRDGRIHWHVGETATNLLLELLSDVPEIASWGIHAWRPTLCAGPHKETFDSLAGLLHTAMQNARDNARIQIERGMIMQCNIIQNLPGIIRSMSLDTFTGRFSGVPAVVIGAGPSLNRNIDALRDAAPGVLLISTDTALHPLLKRGIQPHFVVACDPLQVNHRHFEGISTLGNAVFAYLPETNAGILDQYDTHPWFLCLHDMQSKILQKLTGLLGIQQPFHRRMNVGYCAFNLAHAMGCSPVILAGMDLAVSEGGMSHADGTANVSTVTVSEDGKHAKLQGNFESSDTPLVPVEAYHGGQTLTFAYFYQIVKSLEKSIAEMDVPVIDATEGGARKRGAVQLPLIEALRKYAPVQPVELVLRDLMPRISREQFMQTVQLLKQIHRGLRETRNQLKVGLQRIRQWNQENQQSDISLEDALHQRNVFLNRWTGLLESVPLDMGMDIGLAKWRYATWRAEDSGDLSGPETVAWWSLRIQEWFEGLSKDLELFDKLYALTLQRLQTVLTSGREKQ